jgi:glycosyltransferase involved in cell wall biosynthesis
LKRIAFLGRGVHTIPSYRALLNELADKYQIIVYSEVGVDEKWLAFEHKYSFRQWKAMFLPRRIREILFLFWIIREHLKFKFDLIHAHSTFPTGLVAVILQKIFSVPAVVSLDGGEGVSFPDINFGDAHHPRRTKMNKWIIRNAKVVTVLTKFHHELVKKNLGVTRNVDILNRGVDTELFTFDIQKKVGSPLRLLSVGYLSDIKDPETLLRAFEIIQRRVNCSLTHVGADYSNGKFHRVVEELKLSNKISFVGHVDYRQLPEYYKNADILLHTAFYESQGMVINEAMASGVIVCGTHVGLMSDLADTCCLTAPPGNAEMLAEIVIRLSKDEDKIQQLRTNAIEWSRKNDIKQTLSMFETIYSRILNP